jgi:Flp pilus assembly pilin Flp
MLSNLIAYLTVVFSDVKEREEGQTMVEYALILFFISIACILVLVVLGPQISGIFQQVSAAL